ncbi:26S proteasome non-ATPase regulatory subunit 10-like protein [Trifolium pratense]|uniref:26S proteasome non-ATPase regulatory subunit 10-like protein n=1 Tax=Trifolium pratense TaxID=57577 RepID=A0A2K3MFF7_TRIPR|nr:26S proteasome non-ATPase regulatory subunit 10-like protein [Trifolium pratense]PNX89469.1 26S proteasome non-ATPase regulatory subunit 10-like protein [Trifolium pratense]
MEIDSENIKEKDLFKAAEEGDSSIFESLSPQSLSKSLSLTNEDARSLLHVAASSGHSKVLPFPFPQMGLFRFPSIA